MPTYIIRDRPDGVFLQTYVKILAYINRDRWQGIFVRSPSQMITYVFHVNAEDKYRKEAKEAENDNKQNTNIVYWYILGTN